MMDSMLPLAGLSPVSGKTVVAKFDGGLLSSDGGILVLRETEQRLRAVGGLDWAEAVVACLDGADPDSGTCWELGYAYAKKKLTIVYRTDFRLFKGSDPINLMMTESADHLIVMPTADVVDLAAEIAGRLDATAKESK